MTSIFYIARHVQTIWCRWDRRLDESMPHLLEPISSNREPFLWLLICGVPTIARIVLVAFVLRDHDPVVWSATEGAMIGGIQNALMEETAFRGFPKVLFGTYGLIIGSVFWAVLHQFNEGATPIRLATDILWAIFFVKLWRDSKWRLAVVIHMGWNVGIVLFETMLTLVLIG